MLVDFVLVETDQISTTVGAGGVIVEGSALLALFCIMITRALSEGLTLLLGWQRRRQYGDLSCSQLQAVLSLFGREVRVGPILLGRRLVLLVLLVALLLLLLSNLSVL